MTLAKKHRNEKLLYILKKKKREISKKRVQRVKKEKEMKKAGEREAA